MECPLDDLLPNPDATPAIGASAVDRPVNLERQLCYALQGLRSPSVLLPGSPSSPLTCALGSRY
jgi:hypothetical protein